MPKKMAGVIESKDLATRMKEAKTFHALTAILVAEHEQKICRLQSLLKARLPQADRARHERSIRKYESKLRRLEENRQRYEWYRANKKIPADLRKKIAQLQTDILRQDGSYDSFWRQYVRERKKDLVKLFEEVDQISNPPKDFATKNETFKVGKDYPGQSITRTYDGHIWEVLKWHFQLLPRAKGQRASFRIAAALPEKDEYLQLKERHYERSLEALVDDAYGIVDELQQELQDAYDNMPYGLQEGPVGEARTETAAQLDTIAVDQPELPPCLSSVRIVHYPSLRQSSRRDRAAEAATMMRAAASAAERHQSSGVKLKKAEAKDLDEFRTQLERHADEIGNVEFPGMFG